MSLVSRVLAQPREVVPAVRGLLGPARRATSCASPPRVRGKVSLTNSGALHIGRALTIDGMPVPTKIEVRAGAELRIGTGCFLNYGVDIVAGARITLGDSVLVGPLVSIVDDDMHQIEPGRERRRAPITIGDDVWLGRGVIVLPGATIGDHSVIAAGSVVRGEIPPKVVAGGTPAKVLRELDIPDGWRRI
ncbi:DapH/DapD/GlmU-related protein [Pseudonocardia lacus]|uniref:DapH/DapD/GlmU-related protein n=1 Tax=Pseudonocardia lacus TaxID=2835865 RepID=UPI001BDD1ECE|nr:DapH/DapD/GlmU-related protein [Pseudonocardia lacus]